MDKLKRAMQTAIDSALMEYGKNINSYAKRFVPIHIGTLRESMTVKSLGPGEIVVSTGNSDTPYAKVQYTKSLRHAEDGKGGLISFQQQFSRGPLGKGRPKGTGSEAMYSRAYRLWRKYFKPQPLEAPRWYHRVLSDPDIRKRLRAAFVGKMKAP